MKVIKVKGVRKAKDVYCSMPRQPSYCQEYWYLLSYENNRMFRFLRDIIKKIIGRPNVAYLRNGTIVHCLRDLTSYVVYDDDNHPLLIAPLYTCDENDRLVAGSVSWVNSADFVYANATDIDLEYAFRTLFLFLRDEGCHNLHWNFLHENSRSAVYLREFRHFVYGTSKNTRISLDFPDYDGYVKSLKKSAAQNRRTAYNRLSRANHCLEFSFLAEPKEIPHILEELYITRQKNKYNRKSAYSWFLWKHCNGGLKPYSSNNGFLAQLYIDGKIAAFMAGYQHPELKMVNVPILAIDDAFRFYSPGVLLVSEMAKYMITKLGLTCLYLGRGDEKYKMDMGGVCFDSLHLVVNFDEGEKNAKFG